MPESGLHEARADMFHRDGFVVCRRLLPSGLVESLAAEADRLLQDCADLISPHNLRCRYRPDFETGVPIFEVFDPVNDLSPVCRQVSSDRRILELLEMIYGEPACLFKDKLIFKPPRATGYELHQDIPLAWKDFPSTFLTVLVPIDPSSRENGCTEVFRGDHAGHLSDDPDQYMLPDSFVDPERGVALNLEPGDVAVFHGLTPHRSAPNRSSCPRRTLYLSYNARSDGGDQRDTHYAQFQDRMRTRLEAESPEPVYFR